MASYGTVYIELAIVPAKETQNMMKSLWIPTPPLTSLCVEAALLCSPAYGQTCDLTFQSQVENIPGFGPSPVSDTELAVGEERVLACSNS